MAESQAQWDLGKLDRVLQQYVNYCRRKEIKRTLRGHVQAIGNWIKKAQEFDERDGQLSKANALPGDDINGHRAASASGDADHEAIGRKLAAYRRFKATGMSEWYLECCCKPSERKAILEGDGDETAKGQRSELSAGSAKAGTGTACKGVDHSRGGV
jgi:hypothetical protein